MDAWSSKQIALASPSHKMLTSILKFHMSSDMHFGSDMSSDTLTVLTLSRKNQRLVADEPIEVQDFKKFTDHFRGIFEIYFK